METVCLGFFVGFLCRVPAMKSLWQCGLGGTFGCYTVEPEWIVTSLSVSL